MRNERRVLFMISDSCMGEGDLYPTIIFRAGNNCKKEAFDRSEKTRFSKILWAITTAGMKRSVMTAFLRPEGADFGIRRVRKTNSRERNAA